MPGDRPQFAIGQYVYTARRFFPDSPASLVADLDRWDLRSQSEFRIGKAGRLRDLQHSQESYPRRTHKLRLCGLAALRRSIAGRNRSDRTAVY